MNIAPSAGRSDVNAIVRRIRPKPGNAPGLLVRASTDEANNIYEEK